MADPFRIFRQKTVHLQHCLLYTSDVYKRQVHIIAGTPASIGAAGLVGEGRQCANQRVLGRDLQRHPQQVEVAGPVPVSYTHLDVYKRQYQASIVNHSSPTE